MNRFTYVTMAMVAVTCGGQAWLGTMPPVQAATVIDRFEFKGSIKEFCKGNPKFVEINRATATDGVLLTISRDVNGDGNYTDISAALGLTGAEPDVISMKGRALPRNTSGSKAEFILSGVNPGNADHFLTLR